MTFIYIMDMNKIGLILGGVAVAVNAAAELPQLTYPVAERQDVVDDYFGTKVADPYRWLENDTSAQTAAWVAAQRELTDKYLEALPYRKQIAGELRNLLDMEQIGAPTKKKASIIISTTADCRISRCSMWLTSRVSADGCCSTPTRFLRRARWRCLASSFRKTESICFMPSRATVLTGRRSSCATLLRVRTCPTISNG